VRGWEKCDLFGKIGPSRWKNPGGWGEGLNSMTCKLDLVGGFKHFLFSTIYGIILLTIFFRGVETTQPGINCRGDGWVDLQMYSCTAHPEICGIWQADVLPTDSGELQLVVEAVNMEEVDVMWVSTELVNCHGYPMVTPCYPQLTWGPRARSLGVSWEFPHQYFEFGGFFVAWWWLMWVVSCCIKLDLNWRKIDWPGRSWPVPPPLSMPLDNDLDGDGRAADIQLGYIWIFWKYLGTELENMIKYEKYDGTSPEITSAKYL
jgi:hypothetical protein